MKSKYTRSIFVLLISLSACVPPPRTSTPAPITTETSVPLQTLTPSETSMPTEIPLATNTPSPSIQITSPMDNGTMSCDNYAEEAFCLFHVHGKIGGIGSFSDYRVYVFVFPVTPPGAGWYLQKSPAAIESNGDWEQSPAYLGNVTFPAVTGNVLKLRAALVKADATFNGTTLEDLVKSSDLIVLSTVEDIDGIVALSDIVDLTLDRGSIIVTILPTITRPSQMPATTLNPTFTPVLVGSPMSTSTATPSTPVPSATLDLSFLLQKAFDAVDRQYQETMKSNIAFTKPEQMKLSETVSVELILSPSSSKEELATQIVARGNLVTSTAEPGILVMPGGQQVDIETEQVRVTSRMKAVLTPQNPEAFTVLEMHDNSEQVISTIDPTVWRWSVTAKKEGSQILELIISQLVQVDGKDYWHEVEAYKTEIIVNVTMADRLKALDWKFIIPVILIPLGGAILGWWRMRKSKNNNTSHSERKIKKRNPN